MTIKCTSEIDTLMFSFFFAFVSLFLFVFVCFFVFFLLNKWTTFVIVLRSRTKHNFVIISAQSNIIVS